MDYGFILTRHVTDKKTNEYWNNCVQQINKFYPLKPIVIIDDNSNKEFVVANREHKNVRVIHSEFKGAGELLPYYYLVTRSLFPKAVVIHDSVFFQCRVNFEKIYGFRVLPLWHFKYKEDIYNCVRLAEKLTNSNNICEKMKHNPVESFAFRREDKWFGVFGLQSFVSREFVIEIQKKYNIFGLLPFIKNRADRCSLERVMGSIFYIESPELFKFHSLLGNIWTFQHWGYTYDEYKKHNKYKHRPLVKVWTGR